MEGPHRILGMTKPLAVADGRILTASQAKDLGLVDQVGYLDDVIDLARTEAGQESSARVVIYHRSGSYKPTIYSLPPDLNTVGPQSLYLWWG